MSRMNARASLMLGASMLVLAAASPALADDVHADSAIASVTVFPQGASVVRTATMALSAGDTTIVIDGLPAELDADSLKVDGSGDRAFAIASVETRDVAADDTGDPQRPAIEDTLQGLQDKIDAVDDRLTALDGRKRFLEQLIDTAPGGFGKALAAGNADIASWNTAASAVGSGLADVADAIRAAHIEERDLNKQLDAENKLLADLPAPADRRELRIAVAADAATQGTLSVTYRVQSATWKPTYDAELATGDTGGEPSLTLVRRAEVTQATGENWSGVHLSLSTARADGGTAAPDLQPALVSLYDPRADTESAAGKALGVVAPAPAPPELDAPETAADTASAPPAPATVVEAAADFGDFHAEYDVPGLVSVDSGKGARSLQLATESAAPKLTVKTVPALAETAYLTASFTPPSNAPLLAGNVALFRDGSFVGNGAIAFTEAGADIDLGFGPDDRVHVKRATVAEQTGEHGFIVNTRKTDARSYKITVENLHSRPIDITVLDRVPYAEDEAVAVARDKDATPPTVTNVDDRRGVLAWSYTYAPGESRDILNAYEVSWPSDRDIVSMD